MDSIVRAVELVGTQKALAEQIGVPPACVSQWVNGVRKVPASRCLAIEQATNGAVTRYELLPEVFGPDPDKPATEDDKGAAAEAAA
jgi:DNA-binding transcriptional regulator YdaS (Cro superfamily)